MVDTTADASAIVRSAIRRMTPVERLRQAVELSESVREIALAGLRVRFPDRSNLELAEILLGEALIPRTEQASAHK